MAFPRRLLVEGEELVLDLRPHWIALVGPGLVTVLVLGGWAFLLPRMPAGRAGSALTWLVLAAGLAVLLLYPLRQLVHWATSHFVVTSDRVIHREGLIARASMEIPLEAINDVRFRQGVFERMIGAGDLIIESAGEHGRQVFSDIRHPEEVQRTIYHQGELNQQRMMRGTAPSRPSAASELERLADLRDRGVLTQEEFEQQKARILGRGS
ncbi:MAG TPA: PH domain-containing protein [Actinomycetota bacterium]|nr:PH domain-containing protein [Actinomycetota bacterium]